MKSDETHQYPLLREYLVLKGITLKPAFTVADVAKMFEVSPRTIQLRIAAGKLRKRDLPGRAKILPMGLEEVLSRLLHSEPSHLSSATQITGPRLRSDGVWPTNFNTRNRAQRPHKTSWEEEANDQKM
jgi:hypothetical protein